MKKLLVLTLILALALSLPVTAFAAEIHQDSEQKTVETEITTFIAPTYTVSIPENMDVTFNETSTAWGSIELIAAQIDLGYAVKVKLDASGALKNEVDENKSIAYTINADGEPFLFREYTDIGDKTDLTIDITQEAWDAAYAGKYSDTVVFTVSYEQVQP